MFLCMIELRCCKSKMLKGMTAMMRCIGWMIFCLLEMMAGTHRKF